MKKYELLKYDTKIVNGIAAVRDTHGENSKIGKSYLGICNLIALWFDMPEEIES